MILEPSIDELLDEIDSKYMLVALASKRARNLREAEKDEQENSQERKYVSRALKEISSGELTYESGDNQESRIK